MPKREKAKVQKGTTNDARRNKKAYKTSGIKHRRTSLTPVEKILLGGGSLRNVQRRWREPIKD